MALTGLQIYKLLPAGQKPPHPKANCKECGMPTCLAFAMKLAQKQVELSQCPYVSEEAKAELAAAAAPPIRLITISADGQKVEAGNEVVLFRHEKTFYHAPGLFIRVRDTQPIEEVEKLAREVANYIVDYVGIDLRPNGLAVECASGDATTFATCVKTAGVASKLPLILIADDPAIMTTGLKVLSGEAPQPPGGVTPLIYAATARNWQGMAELARQYKVPLAVRGDGNLSALATLTEEIKGAGVEDLVLDPGIRDFAGSLTASTQIRRLALKNNFRPLGYPLIAFPGEGGNSPEMETALAAQHIAKYAGFIVLDHFSMDHIYPLLVLRQNIYTDPQKPIQVQPGIYEINNPTADSPLMVTTNFSITYFSVANEVESSGHPGWLLVTDAEGMSVLTAWAAGKFDAERIAKAVKTTGIEGKISHRKIIIPGLVAILLGELEEELPGWEVLVGPREAVDITAYLKLWKA
jgi:acetyl-CoA decarbonylase/synthase complex subunit gamma